MAAIKKRILFVSHDASRTGAPIVFKHLIQWFKNHADFDFTILIKNSDGNRGVLIPAFEALGPVIKWPSYTHKKTFFGKISGKLKHKFFKTLPGKLASQPFDLIYINTVDAVDLLPFLKQHHKCPVILHVHENEFSIKAHYAAAMAPQYTSLISRYIAVSKSTRQNLVENFGILQDKVSLVYEFVPVKQLPANTNKFEAIKKQLKPGKEFIAGGSGTADWRKGIDLFIQTAALMAKAGAHIKFVWVGNVDNHTQHQLNYELKRLGLAETDITFTGSVPNPQDYFRLFDVFLLTSREDPFPLVCLEAAAMGTPIICFDHAGGIPELVSTGGGIIVPYADTTAMADKVLHLYNYPQELAALGKRAAQSVQQYDVAVQAAKIAEIVDNIIIH